MAAPTESLIQVATDGSGKKVRNLSVAQLQSDGTVATVYMQVVQIADRETGKVLDLDLKPSLEELIELQRRATIAQELMAGISPEDASLVSGYTARSFLGAAAGPNQPVTGAADPFGRQIVVPWGARDMFAVGVSGTITDTSLQTLKAAENDVYLDMVALLISNTSAATSARVDVSDGTNTYGWQSVGGAPPVGFWGGGIILPASKKGTAWTLQASGAVTDLRAFAVFMRNK